MHSVQPLPFTARRPLNQRLPWPASSCTGWWRRDQGAEASTSSRPQATSHSVQSSPLCQPQLHGCCIHQQISFASRLQRRVRLRRGRICAGLRSQEQDVPILPTPPKPAPKFAKKDLRRIKQEGPTLEDVTQSLPFTLKTDDGTSKPAEYKWVPKDVITASGQYVSKEPAWAQLPQMSFMEFYQGLRERNWTSKYYKEDSEPWKIEIYEDSGRLMQPSWPGFRATVTDTNGRTSWVNMPVPGAETYTYDFMAGGTKGGIWRPQRVPTENVSMHQWGYNQVFEQLFQLYEQQIPKKAEKQFRRELWINQKEIEYMCPGEQLVDVTFKMTPSQPTLHIFWSDLTGYAFAAFAFSFLFVSLGLGIFKPRKQMPTDPIQAMEFAQSKGQARKDGRTGVTFADVAGCDEAVRQLRFVVEFLKDPAKYVAVGGKLPKGILLEGDPGTGKTLVAKAVAGEAGVPFYQMSGSEFVEAIVGVGAARVRDLFKRARVHEGPCIIFVDEIDALGTRRAQAGEKTNEEREQTLNQLLSEMDGFTVDSGVVFVAATNRIDLLDPALMRPGRFDEKIKIARPDTDGRFDILKVHTRKLKLDKDVDDEVLRQVARDLPGLSGAELANVLNEAALETVRRRGDLVSKADIYNGMDRILQGLRRPSMPATFRVSKQFAIHEMGKALVATVLRQAREAQGLKPRLERVERVSIVPRGRDWTRTIFLRGPDEDYTMSTKGRMLERLRVIMAGRAAEQVLLEEGPSTYSVSDLRDASRLAQKIVSSYGMTEAGITMYAPKQRPIGFMKRAFEVNVDNIDRDLFGRAVRGAMYQPSDEAAHDMRMAAHDLMHSAYQDNLRILRAHKDALDAGHSVLLEKEVLMGEEVEQLIIDHPPTELSPCTDGAASSNGQGGAPGRELSVGATA
ncbi:g7506 [Coccomyxa elongata]